MDNELVQRCNSRPVPGERPADFKDVPNTRIIEYRNHCYDIKNIMHYFTNNWWKKNFRFKIDPSYAISYNTTKRLAKKFKITNT